MAEGRGGMAEGEEPHHQVTNSVPVAGGVVSNSTTAQQTMALWRQIQMSMAPGNQVGNDSLWEGQNWNFYHQFNIKRRIL